MRPLLFLLLGALLGLGCGGVPREPVQSAGMTPQDRLDRYTPFRLATDLDALTANERRMLPLLIEAADTMNELFWRQSWGDKDELMSRIDNSATRRFAELNYGPWDRLDDNEPFVEGVGPKPAGARFYPEDMTKEELEQAAATSDDGGEALKGLYTLVRRDDAGRLVAEPYSQVFRDKLETASAKLRQAAALAEDAGLKKYLELRAEALLTDEEVRARVDELAAETLRLTRALED